MLLVLKKDEMLDERSIEETLRKSKVTEKAKMLEKVQSEPLELDCGGVNDCSNKRTRLGESNTAVPVKNVVVSMDSVNEEAPDSDSGANHEISERCRKRPRLNVRNTPKMLKSSPVKKKNKKIERTSKKKQKMKRSMSAKSSRVFSKSRKGMKNEVHAKAAHFISSNSNVIFGKWKGSEVLHSSRYRRDPEALSATMDETYEAFLNHVVVSGNQPIYTPRNGTSKILGVDLQSPSDSEQTILESDRRDGYCPSYVSNLISF